MHLVRAYVMPHHTVTLQNDDTKTRHHYIKWSAQSFIYSARYIIITFTSEVVLISLAKKLYLLCILTLFFGKLRNHI